MALGRKVFLQVAVPQCGVCHALADAGTTGTIGAKLEEPKPDAERVAKAVRDHRRLLPDLTPEQSLAIENAVSRSRLRGAHNLDNALLAAGILRRRRAV